MQKKVWFKNKRGQKLAGVLHIPKGKGPFSAVIICHGFKGCKDKGISVGVSTALAQNGILALRFDFTGSGESEGNFEDISVKQEVQDLHSAIKFIKGLKRVDKNKIGVAGHSLGGGVCFMETATNENIKTVVGIAPTIDGRGWTKYYEKQNRIYYYPKFFLIEGLRIKNKLIKDVSFVIYNLAKKIKVPILIVQGDKDKEEYKYATTFLKKVVAVKRLAKIKGGDHNFREAGFNQMVNQTVRWFKKYL